MDGLGLILIFFILMVNHEPVLALGTICKEVSISRPCLSTLPLHSSSQNNALKALDCLSACDFEGFKYAAVSQGSYCFCGNEDELNQCQTAQSQDCDDVKCSDGFDCGGDPQFYSVLELNVTFVLDIVIQDDGNLEVNITGQTDVAIYTINLGDESYPVSVSEGETSVYVIGAYKASDLYFIT
ncbi:hypothetical protein SK128_015831, partial [Halocaridina rubra]